MGLGLFLVVVGAILAFAVDDNLPDVNLGVAGLIIMLAGAAVIAHARNRVVRERVVTRRDGDAGDGPSHVIEEVIRERDAGQPQPGRDSSY
jgi:hypothetical protein